MNSADHTIYLKQGECHITDDSAVQLSTVLGSCIAACIWDGRAGVGGMNHFLLPRAGAGSVGGSLRYGAHSMETLINGILRHGGSRRNLQAKLFGGANMAANLGKIGSENARFARNFLTDEDIPCAAEDLGGHMARRVLFVPTTGQARVMKVRSTDGGAPVDVVTQISGQRRGDAMLF